MNNIPSFGDMPKLPPIKASDVIRISHHAIDRYLERVDSDVEVDALYTLIQSTIRQGAKTVISSDCVEIYYEGWRAVLRREVLFDLDKWDDKCKWVVTTIIKVS